jgi:hypothetical protein
MRSDVAILVYRLPEALRSIVAAEVKGMEPDVQKKHILAGYGGLLAEQVDTDAYLTDQARRKQQAAASAEGAKRGRVRQHFIADPVARSWKPDYTGKLDPEVFTPRYGTIPKYVLPLLKYMNRVTMGAVLAAAYRVDNRGAFVMQRGKLASWLGTTTRLAGEALDLLRRACVIAVKHQGARGQSTVWRFVKVAEHDQVRAIRILQAASNQASARITADVR